MPESFPKQLVHQGYSISSSFGPTYTGAEHFVWKLEAYLTKNQKILLFAVFDKTRTIMNDDTHTSNSERNMASNAVGLLLHYALDSTLTTVLDLLDCGYHGAKPGKHSSRREDGIPYYERHTTLGSRIPTRQKGFGCRQWEGNLGRWLKDCVERDRCVLSLCYWEEGAKEQVDIAMVRKGWKRLA